MRSLLNCPAPRWQAAFLYLAGLALAGQMRAAPITLHVATNGNDRWTGKLALPARDGKDGPLATVPAALRAARLARQQSGDPEGVTILLRGGTHRLVEPLLLKPEDSGSGPYRQLTIAAFPGEQPVLSGGRSISGWRPVAGQAGLWETDVPAAADGKWPFRTLFVNGQRAQRARTPNEGYFRIAGASPQGQPARFNFQPGDIQPGWAESGDVEVVALLAWADFRLFIRSVDTAKNVVVLSGEARPSNKEENARYYIENAPGSLDAPGEWQLDGRAGRLRYWARPGEDMTTAPVVAPVLNGLVRVQGDFATKRPVQFVTFRGLTFADTAWEIPPAGYADTQAAVSIRGDFLAEGVVDCSIADCVFTRLAGYAIELGRGCQRDRIVGNEVYDVGAGGIRVGEGGARSDPFELNHTHLISDNHLHRLGRVFPPAVGVFVMQSGTNYIGHNHIHDLYYTAISVGWNWGYQETPCRGNIIEYNHLHDIGQAMLSDMGAIYTLGIQQGTMVRYNVIHDVDSFTYGGWGLYPDEGSTGIVWEKNVVYRTKSAGFHQHYGRENVVRNNILAFGKEHQMMRTREEEHVSFFFTNNIVYFNSGDLLGSNWKNERFVTERNVYFDARPGASADSLKLGSVALAEWRRRGHDTNSLFADPLFVAPEQGDFRLQPGSPALKAGFQPIDTSNVGVRRNTRRD